MPSPNNIILIVADSLRYDAVYRNGKSNLRYAEQNAIQFTQARSSGCWTLPAIAAMFSNLMPHEHGATSQTRYFKKEIPSLTEKLKQKGFENYQITANKVTTDIFGLDRGFDQVFKVWEHVTPKLAKFARFLAMMGKPRIRKMIFSRDKIQYQLTEELTAGNCWVQNTFDTAFDHVFEILEKNEPKEKPAFIFMNLMETHFPYHIAPTFKLLSSGGPAKIKEIKGLYHLLNQSFLKSDRKIIKPEILQKLKQRQYESWQLIAAQFDNFIKELHENKNNLVIFCSDHGDNFGEQNWAYHFSNVTDAGNHVPLLWLNPQESSPQIIETPVSARFIHNSILDKCGIQHTPGTLFDHEPCTMPIMESYWYNNQGKTQQKYKYNQICFIEDNVRYLQRKNRWYQASISANGSEPGFVPLSEDADPINDIVKDKDRRQFLKSTLENYSGFSEQIENLAKKK